MRCFVIMGVAGCGKTTVGQGAAEHTGAAFFDGDDLHPPSNVEKMTKGVPLTDGDRHPWLIKVGDYLREADGPVIIGCSALKRHYRDLIRQTAGQPVGFIHLAGSARLISDRVAARQNHFMPTSLIESQFAALQPLAADEDGVTIDIAKPAPEVIAQAAAYVRAQID